MYRTEADVLQDREVQLLQDAGAIPERVYDVSMCGHRCTGGTR